MDLADKTQGPENKSAARWQARIVRRIKHTVLYQRSMGADIGECCRFHLARCRPETAVGILADLAGVDWLYNSDTGEVRFFEFN